MTGLSLVDGNLLSYGRPLLSRVPENIVLTPDSGVGQCSGAFLGATASESNSRHVFKLGHLESGLRFLACFRFKLWWMTQRIGTCGKDIPVETQFLLIESKNGNGEATVCTVFLPIVEGAFRSALQGNENSELELCVESGDPGVKTSQGLHALYINAGTDPFKVISDAMRAVEAHLKSFSLRVEKKLPGMLDWFGWCTWDAFYTDVSAEAVRSGIESLRAGGTPPRFVIIDDGWQSVAADQKPGTQTVTSGTQFASRLTDIRENHKFQKNGSLGLQHVVEEAKNTYNLKYIYVWHALAGYWGGVRPGHYESTLKYPIHSPGVLTNQPDMALDSLTLNGLGIVNPNKAFDFYNDLHSYLASAGIDGVKVDVQNILETLGTGHGGRVQLTKQFHRALEESIARNFPDNGCISCMSHNTDGLYSSKQTAVVRASDDFWPRDPASHTIHIASVAYNSLFLGEIMQPDWDMFHSLHPAAEYHAAARAVGGCGIYVSDKPGQHDFNLLRKLVLPDGSVLRAELPGRPTRDSLFSDPTRDGISLLKIWNMNKHTGVVGAFNCQGAGWCKIHKVYRIHDESPTSITGGVRAWDVEYLQKVADDDWNGDTVVYSHIAGELLRLPKSAAVPVTLKSLQCEIFTIVPLKSFTQDVSFAPIGLIKMFNAGGAIKTLEYSSPKGEDATVKMGIHGCGEFGAYSSQRPKSCSIDSVPNEFNYDADTGLVTFDLRFPGEGKLSNVEMKT